MPEVAMVMRILMNGLALFLASLLWKIKELLPWNWRNNDVPVLREYMVESIGTFPRIDGRESDKETVIEAGLPGMKKQDIEVSISNGALTIKAERREEKERNPRALVNKVVFALMS